MKVTRVNKSIIIEDNISDSINALAPRKTDLKNIIQLTEEYDPNPPAQDTTAKKDQEQEECLVQSKLSGFRRYLSCFRYLWRCICYSPSQFQLDVTDNDFATVINGLKSKKKHYEPVLPPQKEHKKVLVLDLDQTLIHTSFSKPEKYDYQSEVMFNGRATKIYTVKRFGLQPFLFEMSKLFQIVVFTASQKLYADKVIDLIDPKRRVSHRLYREHCIVINKSYYLKNLNILGRNLKEVVIVDDNNIAGILQPENFYRIQPFEGNEKDRQLCRLSAFLKHINAKTDILPVRDVRKRFEEMEINLEEEVIGAIRAPGENGRAQSIKKKQYKHKKSNSEVEELVKRTEEIDDAETTASELFKKL